MWKYDYKQIVKKCEEYGIDRLLMELEVDGVNVNGKSIRSCCPFHHGNNDTAFKYYNGFFTCFSDCAKSYSIIDLVKQQTNLDFKESINFLKKMLNTDFKTNNVKYGKTTEDSRMFLNLMKKVDSNKKGTQFEECDISDTNLYVPILHKKFREENFDNDVRDYFDLRFATGGILSNRIIIPIDDPTGKIAGIAGRSTMCNKDIDFYHTSKYKFINGFDKSKTIYNIGRSKEKIDSSQYLIVVEGYKSVWRLHQWGYDNAVALMGAKMSDVQMQILLKKFKKIIVCGDRDKAGSQLNNEVYNKLIKYVDCYILDLFHLDIPEKSSIAEITKEQFEYLIIKTLQKDIQQKFA